MGSHDCRWNLGHLIYAEGGCGVEVDLKQALYWLEKANEQSGGEEASYIERIRGMLRNARLQWRLRWRLR